jgi:hypothetical protein
MRNGCSQIKEKERKERGEILNEDGRKMRWMKEKERMEKKGGRDSRKCEFLELLFLRL